MRAKIRVFNKHVLNPAMMNLAGRKHWYAAVIRHRGRRSRREYATPVMAEPIAGEAFTNPLLYDKDVDWLKNGQMQTGEVLVAGITTPAWTPLFAVAPAVVADVGESLSYGSIVAREYGIPAVLVSQEIEFAVDGISTEGWQAWH